MKAPEDKETFAALNLDTLRRDRDRCQSQQNIPWFVMVLLVIARVVVGTSGEALPVVISLVFSLGIVALVAWAGQLMTQLEHLGQKSLLLCLRKGGRKGTLDLDEADRRTLRAIEDKKLRLEKMEHVKGWLLLGGIGLLLVLAALPWIAAQDSGAFVRILPGFLVFGAIGYLGGVTLLRRYQLSDEERAVISILAGPGADASK